MPSRKFVAAATAAALVAGLAVAGTALASSSGAAPAAAPSAAPAAKPGDPRPPVVDRSTLPRTIITTDGEWDDQNSFIRLMYYSNDLDIAGLVYGSANHHWKGDGVHTLQQAKDAGILTSFLGENNQGIPAQSSINQTQWRWPGTTWMDDFVLNKYSQIYPNLIQQDPNYPTPADLWSKIAVGNVDFDSDFHADTPGSDLIKQAILDDDTRPLYLEAWGGTNTIARALKSIEDEYKNTSSWPAIQAKVNKKAVIAALGMQDNAYKDYIGPNWPGVELIVMGAGPGCTAGQPNFTYCSPQYWTPLKYGHGPLMDARALYGDGSFHPLGGNTASPITPGPGALGGEITSNGIYNYEPGPAKDMATWRLYNGGAAHQRLEFAGEGDSPTFLFLLNNGLRGRTDLSLGSWGGRYKTTTNAITYGLTTDLNPYTGAQATNWTSQRWIAEMQNDFAGRIEWGISPTYAQANHAPVVTVKGDVSGKPGKTVAIGAEVSDPDGNKVKLNWAVYTDASTVTSPVTVQNPTNKNAYLTIPADAKAGQRIVVVLTATDNGLHSLSRYGEVVVTVK
jgi:hypothetical protein